MSKKKMNIQDMTSASIMAAVTAIMAQISIPMPLGVPMTLQTFAITVTGVILGSRNGFMAILIYIAIGLAGIPVFAGFTGGIQSLAGPTGGFLISFPLMAYIIGKGIEKKSVGMFALYLFIGTAVNYIIGLVMFMILTGASLKSGMIACVIPFIPTALIKMILGAYAGLKIRRRLGFEVLWKNHKYLKQ